MDIRSFFKTDRKVMAKSPSKAAATGGGGGGGGAAAGGGAPPVAPSNDTADADKAAAGKGGGASPAAAAGRAQRAAANKPKPQSQQQPIDLAGSSSSDDDEGDDKDSDFVAKKEGGGGGKKKGGGGGGVVVLGDSSDGDSGSDSSGSDDDGPPNKAKKAPAGAAAALGSKRAPPSAPKSPAAKRPASGATARPKSGGGNLGGGGGGGNTNGKDDDGNDGNDDGDDDDFGAAALGGAEAVAKAAKQLAKKRKKGTGLTTEVEFKPRTAADKAADKAKAASREGSPRAVAPAPPAAPKKPRGSPASATKVPPDIARAGTLTAAALAAALAPGGGGLADDDIAFVEEGGGWGDNTNAPPPKKGLKPPPPESHPDALAARSVVVTGVLESLTRDEFRDLVMRHGGRLTGAVSGKTAVLVVGGSASRNKVRAAREKARCPVVDEDGFFEVLRASQPALADLRRRQDREREKADHERRAAAEAAASAAAAAALLNAPPPGGAPSSAAAGPSSFALGPGATPAAAAAAARAAALLPPPMYRGEQMLWVDKHKPKTSAELVGNNVNVTALRQWLAQWEAVHLRGAAPRALEGAGGSGGWGKGGNKYDMSKKAVLLSGPPGIGKTSAAHIVARELGFDVVEVNASDARSKADAKIGAGVGGKLSNMVKELVRSESVLGMMARHNGNNSNGGGTGGGAGAIAGGGGGGGKGKAPASGGAAGASAAAAAHGGRSTVLVMDEVDGMSAGDRGGVADLIATIRSSRVPVVCICNDRFSQKLKALRGHCMDLEYRRPTAQQVAKRCAEIARREGLSAPESALISLAEGAHCDIRLVVGQLQMARLRGPSLSWEDVRRSAAGCHKDAPPSSFECARVLLDGASAGKTVLDRMDLAFTDVDMVPLLVQENYVNHRPTIGAGSELLRLRALAKAADAISLGEVANNAVRARQQWSLMPYQVLVGTVTPAAYMRGPREALDAFPGESNWPRFTAALGHGSTAGKQRRLLSELCGAMAAAEGPGGLGGVGGGRGSVRLDYLPALRVLLPRPLKEEGGAEATIEMMREHGISRDALDYVLDVTKFRTRGEWGADPMAGVPAKSKAAFTRAFNAGGGLGKPRTARQAEEGGGIVRRGRGGKVLKAAKVPKGRGGTGGGGGGGGSSDEGEDDDEGGGWGEGAASDADGGGADLAEGAGAGRRARGRSGGAAASGDDGGGGPSSQGKGGDGDDGDDDDEEALARRLSARGVKLEPKRAAAPAAAGGGRGGRGGGRGAGTSGRGGRGGGGGKK